MSGNNRIKRILSGLFGLKDVVTDQHFLFQLLSYGVPARNPFLLRHLFLPTANAGCSALRASRWQGRLVQFVDKMLTSVCWSIGCLRGCLTIRRPNEGSWVGPNRAAAWVNAVALRGKMPLRDIFEMIFLAFERWCSSATATKGHGRWTSGLRISALDHTRYDC